EGQGAGRTQLDVQLVPGALVHQQVDVLRRGDTAVLAALGADIERPDEALLDVDMTALIALLPGIGWNLQLHPFGAARFALFLKPSHSRHKGGGKGHKLRTPAPRRQPRPSNLLPALRIPDPGH